MKNQTCFALSAAALLLAGVSAASAAPALPSTLAAPPVKVAAKMAPAAHDTLNLTSAQQKIARKDLHMKSLNQPAPSGYQVAVGAVVPKNIATGRMTAKAAGDVPALKPYRFAELGNKLVIVNPTDRKIADVISG
jgi:hypothetical protein